MRTGATMPEQSGGSTEQEAPLRPQPPPQTHQLIRPGPQTAPPGAARAIPPLAAASPTAPSSSPEATAALAAPSRPRPDPPPAPPRSARREPARRSATPAASNRGTRKRPRATARGSADSADTPAGATPPADRPKSGRANRGHEGDLPGKRDLGKKARGSLPPAAHAPSTPCCPDPAGIASRLLAEPVEPRRRPTTGGPAGSALPSLRPLYRAAESIRTPKNLGNTAAASLAEGGGLQLGEAEVEPSRVEEHHDEGPEPTGAALDAALAEVGPIDLGLLGGQGAQLEEGVGGGLGRRASWARRWRKRLGWPL